MLSQEERQRIRENGEYGKGFNDPYKAPYQMGIDILTILAELEAAEARLEASSRDWDIEAAGIREELSKATVDCLQADVRITELETERDALREALAEANRVMSEPVQIYCPECGRSTNGFSHGCVICEGRKRARAALEGK